MLHRVTVCLFAVVMLIGGVYAQETDNSDISMQELPAGVRLADNYEQSTPGFAEEYPGISEDGGQILDVAVLNMQYALQAYYRITGGWPDAWQDVVEAGLYQVPLIAFGGDTIDPDDGELEFYGDVAYDPVVYDGSVKLFELTYRQGPYFKVIQLDPLSTYQESVSGLSAFPEFSAEQQFWAILDRLDSPDWSVLYAIVGQCRKSAETFRMLNGYYPCTFEDLLDSGLAPIDYESVNPLTGVAFAGDGSALDIYYHVNEDGDQIRVVPVEPDGSLPRMQFTY